MKTPTAIAIREARKAKGLTQQQLGEIMGYASGLMISRWENGITAPNINNLIELASVLGVSTDYLLGVNQ